MKPISALAAMILAMPLFSVYADDKMSVPALPPSPTEGVITHEFVEEPEMKADLLQMLADFTLYMTSNVAELHETNSDGEEMISFIGENTFGNNEQGVRHNADMGMICAFLVKYAKDKVTLPEGVSWAQLEDLAHKSLVYSYSTHKANRLYPNKDNRYWGSSEGKGQWESSLWAMSVAYSAFFQWNKLGDIQKDRIRRLLESECEYELLRDIPTGYDGDTKAEENGWEADVLAAALGLFPDHEKAPQWFDRLREFAVNSYSHSSDANDTTVIDPEYDGKRVCDLYRGANLFDDYTLQNHHLFHTSYQNVVMQELGEAALALKLFQNELHGGEKWKTNSLMHNNQEVMDNVLNRLALADGELAMPNGNDWSLFLFDQITSYSTMACFLADPNALFLENMAYKYIKARQKTTPDGSWLLRSDVGARRMGVEGHRVMMTWLMHEVMPTASVKPATWNGFLSEYGKTYFFPCQNIVKGSSADRFTTFSWSDGLKSYTGYIASNNPDNNKIIVPYRANNTGNFIGWYDVEGRATNASPVVKGILEQREDSYVMNGELNTNDSTLNNRFAIYSGPKNAVIYLDEVTANADVTINGAKGGLMAISVDEFTRPSRRLYHDGVFSGYDSDGSVFVDMETEWVNIDGQLGFVTLGNRSMGFGDRGNNNSIMTARLYPLYSRESRTCCSGDKVDYRNVIYYTNVDAAMTRQLADRSVDLGDNLPEGWNGIMACEPDGSYSFVVSNFSGRESGSVSDVTTEYGAPVFPVATHIKGSASTVKLDLGCNRSLAGNVRAFVSGDSVIAISDPENPGVVMIFGENGKKAKARVTITGGESPSVAEVKVDAGKTMRVKCENGEIVAEVGNNY